MTMTEPRSHVASAPPRGRSGLAALFAACGVSDHAAPGRPVVLTTACGSVEQAILEAGAALDRAGRVVVLVHADPSVDHLLTIADADDPLVRSTVVPAIGVSHPLVGLSFPVADAVVLDHVLPSDARTVVTADGRTVAAVIERPTGTIVLVGTDRILDDRWLAAKDTAAFVAWAFTGRLDTSAVTAAVKSVRPTANVAHVRPRVVWSPGDEQLLELLPAGEVPVDDPSFAAAAARAGRLLSPEVHDALVDFVDHGHPSGALLIKGLPVGDLPETPPSPRARTAKDHVSEFVLLTAARRLGQPIGYAPEHSGELVQNLVPTAGAATSQTSTSSAVVLEFHTEAAFHRHKPRFLLLLCLRSDPFREAETLLCSIAQVLDDLPLSVRHTLTEPRFRTGVDESYTNGRSGRLGRPTAVLTGDHEHPSLTFDADLMVGIDTEADEALQELRCVVKARHIGVALEAGDLLVVDNSAAVHGRSAFRARFDGTDRWLQRTFVVADLAASASERRHRVVTTRFAD